MLPIIQPLGLTVTSPTAAFSCPVERARLPYPYRSEAEAVDAALARVGALDWPGVVREAAPWVAGVRANPAPFWAMESLLREYPISSAEGLALMRLAEALLRVPDTATAVALTADQLGRADFDGEGDGASGGPHRMLASLSASAISLSKKFLPGSVGAAENEGGLMQRLGAKTVVAATVRAIGLLGRQFVLGRDIGEAIGQAHAQRREQDTLRFSYDMLGEGARTERDAERYLASYRNAIAAIARAGVAASPEAADGISIKLSALFSRYEVAQRERVIAELLPRVWSLIEPAARANMNLTIDAEESDRLELSLEVFEALAERIAAEFPQWRGFGLAIQAYQTRALAVIDEAARIARSNGLRFMVRLVKGAYWDGEIKRAQEMGLAGYPVFTHKAHTDASYLAGARALVGHADVVYPQFATHNAGTIAAVIQMAQSAGAKFELQRLHGMGVGVYREVLRQAAPPTGAGAVPVRIYAPVGEHRDLLAYLVRRLLENGANSSFVNQLADESVGAEALLALPLSRIDAIALPLPRDLYGAARLNSRGVDLACLAERAPLDEALSRLRAGQVPEAGAVEVDAAMSRLAAGFAAWNATPAAARAAILRRAAGRLEARLPEFCAWLVNEAHKTLGDCVAEVREAVDFLRYYADEAERRKGTSGCGVFVCISPWNFPLAIFAGQVAAALATGNAVAAKPAEQTPFVAQQCVRLLHEAGVPADALALLHGPGETVGARLVADAHTAGVCFTGSTPVAQAIHRSLAAKAGPPVPLIAETGGLNAMVVDSTALPEQVIDAVVQSAFRSTGQRCSALRLLCVHESIADALLEMLAGAMAELCVGDAHRLATDVAPAIDAQAHANLARHIERLRGSAKLIAETPQTLAADAADAGPTAIAPIAFEIERIDEMNEEIFGPVLQVVRWGGEVDAVVDQINALGYGLTLGVQTRIDGRAQRIADRARIGNVYVNRNMIGAVVGVQPFGGEGLSGTGPKAGGPHYLDRFVALPVAAEPRVAASSAVPAVAPPPSSPLAAAVTDSPNAISWLATGAGRWAARSLDERVAVVQHACTRWAGAHAAVALADGALAALADQSLPGPTGESNTLRLHPRGVFALLADGASDNDTAAAVAAALLAGNSVAVVGAAAGASLREAFVAAGVDADALILFAADQAPALLAASALTGVAVLASDVHAACTAAQALARREGPILPLILRAEATRPDRLWRWCSEQTVTINTAAAGGNAELLTAAAPQAPLAQAASAG